MDCISIAMFMGTSGLTHLTLHIFTGLSTFVIAPVPLFIFMVNSCFTRTWPTKPWIRWTVGSAGSPDV